METLYSKSEKNIVQSFMNDLKTRKYIPEPVEFKSNKAKKLYDSFIDLTVSSKPKIYHQNDFIKFSYEDITNIFLYTVYNILGQSKEVNEAIKEFFESIKISNDEEIFSGVNLNIVHKETGKIKRIIEVPSINNTSSIVSLIHEFIHMYISKKNMSIQKKYYYNEILSIYAEKVATDIIEKNIMEENNFTKKIENTRLEGISWHYKDRIDELELAQKSFNLTKNSSNPNKNFLIELISSYPWLIDTNLKNAYLLYYSNLAYSYGFGYIYAEALFNKYLEDNNKTSSKVKDTLNGNIKMDELFNYYKIGINQPTITTAKQKVKTVTE